MIYKMQTKKTTSIDHEKMILLSEINLAPYIQVGSSLIAKKRKSGGNMFRHQCETLSILLNYGYTNPILLKASLIHDVVEDIPNFDRNIISNLDEDGPEVLKLVLEVTKQNDENKHDFLKRIIHDGSQNAKLLKSADRISNMISLGYVTDPNFIARTCDDTEAFILPTAILVDYEMYQELIDLLKSRQKYLEDIGYYSNCNKS